MLRIILLLIGLTLSFIQSYNALISVQTQFLTFLFGILLLGIPHGAADLLVANRNETLQKQYFSTVYFLLNYVGRLLLFALILWFFPVMGNILFIFLAAYHFGETDLHRFRTDTYTGKFLVITYGLVILSIILLPHYEEVKQIFLLFPSGEANISFINDIEVQRQNIILACFSLFVISIFNYYRQYKDISFQELGQVLLQLLVILFIVYRLPMLLGFTFYFVFWHSILSLTNIVKYLKRDKQNSYPIIIKQVSFYSSLAIVGIAIFGYMGTMLISSSVITGYLFLGLAVLTAPHMEVMHEMYKQLRSV
jgi:beta-carotene 15,15'-dioxygenase